MNIRILPILFLLAGFSVNVRAQEPVRTDTLPAAIKRASLLGRKTLSERVVIQKDLNVLASPTGDPDFVKFIQTLPGVATGSDGSSSYYVRGGNMGGNVQTLDGVTIYGSPHLVGLTTAYPADIVSVAEFQVGGFTSEEGNLSASHIKLSSRDGSFDTFSAKADISNFMLGGCVSTPLVKDRLSLMASFRVSPAPFEYKAISGMIDRDAIDISNASAAIYDIYAKLKYRFDGKRSLSASFFHSRDNYKFRMNSGSEDMMSWDNAIGILQYEAPWFGKGRFRLTASYNHYGNSQGMEKQMNTTSNDLMIRSLLEEGMVHALVETPFGKDWHTQFGLKGRMAWFNPGSARVLETTGLFPKTSSPLVDNTRKNATGTLHGQVSKGSLDRSMFRVAGRLNYNSATGLAPEASALGRLRLTRHLGVEVTADYLVQYYHSLEGIPLGWSLDMIIPPSEQFKPETAVQVYAGLYGDAGIHHFSAGAYYKDMDRLVYFSDASKLFDSAIVGWEENIRIGSGTSRGLEFLYEKTGELLNWRIAYTLSRTDRHFPELNKGVTFPAKYDRTHILNASATVRVLSRERMNLNVSGQFTWQSGHMETVSAGSWWISDPITGYVEQDFYTSFNNYRMPPYVRCDVSAVLELTGRRHPQTLHVGVYNLLNRHNPFSLSYDPDTGKWKQISLLPIMPSLKYSIQF